LVEVGLNTDLELSWLASFANSIVKSGDLPRSAPQSIDSRPECHALLMRETIASLDRCPYLPPRGSTETLITDQLHWLKLCDSATR
jgi:hypothetical protein